MNRTTRFRVASAFNAVLCVASEVAFFFAEDVDWQWIWTLSAIFFFVSAVLDFHRAGAYGEEYESALFYPDGEA